MSKLILALAGVVLLALVALGLIWLAGQLFLGIGIVAVGMAGVLLRLLWFLLLTGVVGGATYFIGYAWRPGAGRAVNQAGARPQGNLIVASAVPQLEVEGRPQSKRD